MAGQPVFGLWSGHGPLVGLCVDVRAQVGLPAGAWARAFVGVCVGILAEVDVRAWARVGAGSCIDMWSRIGARARVDIPARVAMPAYIANWCGGVAGQFLADDLALNLSVSPLHVVRVVVAVVDD